MILCVDPSEDDREATRAALDSTYEVRTAASLSDAQGVLSERPVECLVTEYDLPDGTGLELVRAVRNDAPDAACILFTDTALDEIDTAAFGDVVAEYLPKDDPDAHGELAELVEHALLFRNQTAYPLPDDEDARVAALERYATDPESLGDSLDRLTELATALFDLDAAAIGLIDAHEQRFLSCFGISFGPVEREETVCTYALLDEGVTVIEDTSEDPRFEDNEGLQAADIRFYASAPITTPEGHTIGTFCVYGDDPRTVSERERELLSLLADEAMEQLVLRRRLRDSGGERDE
ncbi:GAF domain-containing protein [Natronomonas gomsonensis]|uniref:GAF domain-containing protein n=1 Tax=Natronomonas gomsonensis TaxID=1046043 RepID=UPI0020CA5AE5|nr:GAF domain-containing protein [Natronomonas gomsonensis]MCY4731349.1 GAF domain-containing protein [Natronomonas gomsonensis]